MSDLDEHDRELFKQILVQSARERERTQRIQMVLGFCFFVVIMAMTAFVLWVVMA